jgi:hypothetical protein
MKTTAIEAVVLKETAKAFYLTINGCHSSAWVPKSQMSNVAISVEDHGDGSTPSRYLDAEIPVWLWNKLPVNDGPIPYATKPW